jgi:hypothetical protein
MNTLLKMNIRFAIRFVAPRYTWGLMIGGECVAPLECCCCIGKGSLRLSIHAPHLRLSIHAPHLRLSIHAPHLRHSIHAPHLRNSAPDQCCSCLLRAHHQLQQYRSLHCASHQLQNVLNSLLSTLLSTLIESAG